MGEMALSDFTWKSCPVESLSSQLIPVLFRITFVYPAGGAQKAISGALSDVSQE
jgi:hypothetical protein